MPSRIEPSSTAPRTQHAGCRQVAASRSVQRRGSSFYVRCCVSADLPARQAVRLSLRNVISSTYAADENTGPSQVLLKESPPFRDAGLLLRMITQATPVRLLRVRP